MKLSSLKKTTILRLALITACVVFCVATLVWACVTKNANNAFMSALSVLYVFIPMITERLFKFRIQATLYVFVMFYTICPLLGYAYNFYHIISWWDDIMHAFSGVIFAMFGAYLPIVLNKNKSCSVALCAFCAFFLSVAIAGLWELIEFSTDTLFGTDMQKDTQLLAMRPSYMISELLGLPVGELAEVSNAQIVINGQTFNQYVDIGLLDSMKDMLVESAGAAVYTLIYVAGKGKYFLFLPLAKPQAGANSEEAFNESETEAEAEAAIAENSDEIQS